MMIRAEADRLQKTENVHSFHQLVIGITNTRLWVKWLSAGKKNILIIQCIDILLFRD